MMLPLLLAIQEHAPAAEGALPAPFQPGPGLIIWTWVVFVPLLVILAKLVLPMIVKAGAEREAAIAKSLADADGCGEVSRRSRSSGVCWRSLCEFDGI